MAIDERVSDWVEDMMIRSERSQERGVVPVDHMDFLWLFRSHPFHDQFSTMIIKFLLQNLYYFYSG